MRTTRSARRGFTLFELLLAAAVSSVIAAAVMQAIYLAYAVESRQAETMAAVATARGLLREVGADIAAIVPEAPSDEPAELLEGLATQVFSGFSDGPVETMELTEAEAVVDPPRLIGTETSLLLLVERPPGAAASMSEVEFEAEMFAPPQRIRTVLWGVADDGLAAEAEDAIRVSGVLEDDTWVWIDGELPAEGGVVAFAYFDGEDWYADWDSDVTGMLPRAIEVAVAVPVAAVSDASETGDVI
ncbi:MAG: prepilin-type N-terminal cleavage/methylation domain-containing protein, partial [Planctomycetota bacterium]